MFSALLLICGVALARCSLQLLFLAEAAPLPHRAVLEKVPDVAFQATYIGQLLGLYLAHKIAQVRHSMLYLAEAILGGGQQRGVIVCVNTRQLFYDV